MKLENPKAKYEVISILAPYVKPKEIKEHFGINYATVDHYCKEYGIPKWQKSYSQRKKDHDQAFKDNEAYEIEVRLRMAKAEAEKIILAEINENTQS